MIGERQLDIVVFGATGYTGQLVARYLPSHAPEGGPHGTCRTVRAPGGRT